MNAPISPLESVAFVDLADPATPGTGSACCGGSPKADASACCVLDEQKKTAGQDGCGCSASVAPQPAPAGSGGCCG